MPGELNLPSDQNRFHAVKTEADWYNEFYKKEQHGLAPWYRFLLTELNQAVSLETKLVELGCGQGHILRVLVEGKRVAAENITGVDQSQTAVDFCRSKVPGANFITGDIYDLKQLPTDGYDICLLMETIEHLENPAQPLANLYRILKPGGLLYLSFPNYLHAPWLAVRILAEKLNRPNWIVLQPVDKIYTVFGIKRLLSTAGFKFVKGIGSNYGPPVLYPLETDGLTRLLNSLGQWWWSFHPILVFRKQSN